MGGEESSNNEELCFVYPNRNNTGRDQNHSPWSIVSPTKTGHMQHYSSQNGKNPSFTLIFLLSEHCEQVHGGTSSGSRQGSGALQFLASEAMKTISYLHFLVHLCIIFTHFTSHSTKTWYTISKDSFLLMSPFSPSLLSSPPHLGKQHLKVF